MNEVLRKDVSAPVRRGKDASAPSRKGWCPGALRPMMARDGLIVRLRITGGIVPAATARALAGLAARHGNGLFDLSARGNLQMRGIGETALAGLHDGLRTLDLLDADPGAEAVRNVIASPLAGLRDGLDIRPLVARLEARLSGDEALHGLPTKFGFLVDDGAAPSLAAVAADVRFDWIAADGVFSIGIGGTRRTALRVGTCAADDLIEAAGRAARGALRLFASCPEARRMHALVAAFGQADVAARCGDGRVGATLDPVAATTAADIVGLREIEALALLGLAAPFGRLDDGMLRRAADLAEAIGTAEIRLTPWRALLLPLHRSTSTADANAVARRADGFITDPRDPRLAVAACVGMAGCERGTTPTHADADALADLAARLGATGISLHVSGCEKGCAKPSASPITLVGREGRYDLVRAGRPGDPPLLRALDVDAARAVLATMMEPA